MQALEAYNAAVQKHGTDREAVYRELQGDAPKFDTVFPDKSKLVVPANRKAENPFDFVIHHDGTEPYTFYVTDAGAQRLTGPSHQRELQGEPVAHGQPLSAKYTPPPPPRGLRGMQQRREAARLARTTPLETPIFGGESHATPEEEQRGVPRARVPETLREKLAPSRQFTKVDTSTEKPPPRTLEESDAFRYMYNKDAGEHAMLRRPENRDDAPDMTFGPGHAVKMFPDGSFAHYHIGPAEGPDDSYHPVTAWAAVAPNLRGVPGKIHTYIRNHLEAPTELGREQLPNGTNNPWAGINVPTPHRINHIMQMTGEDGKEYTGEPVEHVIGRSGEFLESQDGESLRTTFRGVDRRVQAIAIAGDKAAAMVKEWESLNTGKTRQAARLRAALAHLDEHFGSIKHPDRRPNISVMQQNLGSEVEEQYDVQKLEPKAVRDFVIQYQHLHPNSLSPAANKSFDPEGRFDPKARIPEDRESAWIAAQAAIYGSMRALAGKSDAEHAYDRYGKNAPERLDAIRGLVELMTGQGTRAVPHSGVAFTNRAKAAVRRAEAAARPKPPKPERRPGGAPAWPKVAADHQIRIVDGNIFFRRRDEDGSLRSTDAGLEPGTHDAILNATTLGELAKALREHREWNDTREREGRGVRPHKAVVRLSTGHWVETHVQSGHSYIVPDARGHQRNARRRDVTWALFDVDHKEVVRNINSKLPPDHPSNQAVALYSIDRAKEVATTRGGRHLMIPVIDPEFEDPMDTPLATGAPLTDNARAAMLKEAERRGTDTNELYTRGRPLSGVVNGQYSAKKLAGYMPAWADHVKHAPRAVEPDGSTHQIQWRGADHIFGFRAVNDQMDRAEAAANEELQRSREAALASTAAVAQEQAAGIEQAARAPEPSGRPFTEEQLSKSRRRAKVWAVKLGRGAQFHSKHGFSPVPPE